jgi:hypothetical protein
MRSQEEMQQLVSQADEYDIEAWVAWDDRFGWVVRANTPFHDDPVVLRCSDDIMCLIAEMFMRDGDEREPADFFVDAP